MLKRNVILTIALLLTGFLTVMLSGCGKSSPLDPKNPVTLSLWHTYDQQMKAIIDEFIDEFNSTRGRREGIIVETAFVAVARDLHEKLLAAASGDPGAPELPDIAVVYPSAAVTLIEKGLLMDFATQFKAEELSSYIGPFLDEGRLGDGALYILPIAKSTEVLYVNTVIFERFSRDSGISLSQLATVEGILDAAEKYYAWTDGQTPGIPNDGKAFFYPGDLFNFTFVGFRQLGGNFVPGRVFNLSSPAFQKIWDFYYPNAVRGNIAIFNRYSNYLFQTGEVVCATDTSASVTFLPNVVNYPDNTTENAVFAVLPYPVFEGGEKVALQRGGGMCVLKSDTKKEYAAGVFLKWFTESEQNLRFTSHVGYLPVTEAAFGAPMARAVENIDNENIRKVFEAIAAMQKDYTFVFPPVFDGFEAMQNRYKADLLKTAGDSKRAYGELIVRQGLSSRAAFDEASKGALESFIEN